MLVRGQRNGSACILLPSRPVLLNKRQTEEEPRYDDPLSSTWPGSRSQALGWRAASQSALRAFTDVSCSGVRVLLKNLGKGAMDKAGRLGLDRNSEAQPMDRPAAYPPRDA